MRQHGCRTPNDALQAIRLETVSSPERDTTLRCQRCTGTIAQRNGLPAYVHAYRLPESRPGKGIHHNLHLLMSTVGAAAWLPHSKRCATGNPAGNSILSGKRYDYLFSGEHRQRDGAITSDGFYRTLIQPSTIPMRIAGGVALTTRRAGLHPDTPRAGKDVASACPYRKANIDDPDERSSTLAGAL